MRRWFSRKAAHSAVRAQAWTAAAATDDARCVQGGSAFVCTAPPSTKTPIAERSANVAGGEVRALKRRRAAWTARRAASG